VKWSLSHVEEFFGTSGPELVVAVQEAPEDALQDLAELLLDEDLCPQAVCDRLQVWPLFNSRMSSFEGGKESSAWASTGVLGGLSPLVAADPRHATRNLFPRGVARTLLYSHGIVLEDPIPVSCSMYLSASSERREIGRSMVNSAIQSAVEIAPLVKNDVIVPYWRPGFDQDTVRWVSEELNKRIEISGGPNAFRDEAWDLVEAVYVDGLDESLQEVWRRIRAGDRAPDLNLIQDALETVGKSEVSSFLDIMQHLNPEVSFANMIAIIAHVLDDVLSMGGAIDFYAPTALFTRFLLATDPAPQDVDAARIRELARMNVPGLEDLSWSDIVSMRQNEDAFDLWRHQLSLGLQESMGFRSRGEFVDSRRCVSDALIEGRIRIQQMQNASGFLSQLGKSSIAFTLGSLGGAVAGSPGGQTATIFGAAGGGIGAALPSLVPTGNRVPNWLARHYLMFELPRP
jgi:hypothetical protein